MVHRVGIIGAGSIGLRMLGGIVAHPGFEAVRVWDPSPAACERAVLACPGLAMSASADEVIGSPDVDVVYVACPPRFHRAHALAAIDAGKPILCEKPLGVDLEESRDLVRRVEASGLPNVVNLVYASARASQELQAAFVAGDCGALLWVDIHLHLPGWAARRYREAPWLAERAQGGFIREVTTHFVFLCQRLLGDLSLRSAMLDFPADGAAAECFADVRLDASGIPITITGATAGAGPEVNHVSFWGERRAHRIRDLHVLEVAVGEQWSPVYPPIEHPELDTYLRQLDNLGALLDGQDHTLADFRAALETQAVIEAILARGSAPA